MAFDHRRSLIVDSVRKVQYGSVDWYQITYLRRNGFVELPARKVSFVLTRQLQGKSVVMVEFALVKAEDSAVIAPPSTIAGATIAAIDRQTMETFFRRYCNISFPITGKLPEVG